MSLVLIDKNNQFDRIRVGDDQVARFRALLKEEYASQGKDPKALHSRNEVWIDAQRAVEILERRGFEWGREFDAEQKLWVAVWMSRALRPRRKKYPAYLPKYLEFF